MDSIQKLREAITSRLLQERSSKGTGWFLLSFFFLKFCASVIPGTGRPTISMNGLGSSNLSVRKNSGGMTISDCNNVNDLVTVEVSEGSLTFDSSCTAVEMVARGVCKFINDSAGATVYDEVIRPSDVIDIPIQVWNHTQ